VTDPETEFRYLQSAAAVRKRCSALYQLALGGKLAHFAVDESRLPALAEYVIGVTRAVYPDVRAIPYHGRYRHFSAGGVDRLASIAPALGRLSPEERLMAEFELIIISVLLDAGAGERWSYRDAAGLLYSRSEGLAAASFDWFASGGLADDPARAPLTVSTRALAQLTPAALALAFQVSEDNPLLGLEGRVELMRRLGRTVASAPEHFGDPPRLGYLALGLRRRATGGQLPATALLETLLAALGPIWPGRDSLAGHPLGDVWQHPALGRVPFHKLSQWLSYSLCEPLEAAGLEITALGELTGLAEYRNGGLFVDGGVLLPKHDGVLNRSHAVGSELVVEWRALTVALLDRIAERIRVSLGLSPEELPLARVLEGGTWRAGRALAAERNPSAAPPIGIDSDGTVF
jgi:hypothetical protein